MKEYIIAFCGTEKNIKDVIVDLAAELIFFFPSKINLVTVKHKGKLVDAGVLAHFINDNCCARFVDYFFMRFVKNNLNLKLFVV